MQYGVLGVVVAGGILFASVANAFAESSISSSQNYQATELQFGSGDNSETCDGSYCASTSVGGMASGESKSSKYVAAFGDIPEGQPLLEVIVDNGTSDLGEFSPSQTSYKTISVKVRNYLSEGYIIQLMGSPLKHRAHTIASLSEPTASQVGKEQFGVNVVANTTPFVGKNPVQVPSSEFSFGRAADNYATPDRFMYKSGDVVALSDSSTGETDYTISMIVNVAASTPAGRYTSDFSAVVIPSY